MVQQGNELYCKGVSASWNSGPVNRATHQRPALVLDNLICESSSHIYASPESCVQESSKEPYNYCILVAHIPYCRSGSLRAHLNHF